MLSLLLLTVLVAPPDEKPKARPAVMLLDLKGKAEIRPVEGNPRAAEVGDLLYPDEVLAVPADASATVAILGAGARETIRPGTEAKIGPKGCTPPASVLARKEQPRAVASTMRGLKPSADDGRKAGVGFRSKSEDAGAITPIHGATVTSDRPALSWPAAEKVTIYRVRMISGAGRELWRAETKEPRLDFPGDKPPLQEGYPFRWEVTDQDYRKVAAGEFSVATASERTQIDELKALTASGDAADRYSAALAYRRLAAFAEAIAVLEGLNRDVPDEHEYRRMLEDLRRTAGLSKQAGTLDAPK
jgi:hypothetical protein